MCVTVKVHYHYLLRLLNLVKRVKGLCHVKVTGSKVKVIVKDNVDATDTFTSR